MKKIAKKLLIAAVVAGVGSKLYLDKAAKDAASTTQPTPDPVVPVQPVV